MGSSQLEVFARAVSRIFGWLYTLSWSLSFYPQPWSNIQQRSTRGLTPDFPLLNVAGFLSYTLSTAALLFSATIRAQYAARHTASPEPTVRGNDFAFALHALVLVAITYSQFYPRVWRWEVDGKANRNAGRVSLGILWGCGVAVAGAVVGVLGSGNGGDEVRRGEGGWEWIDVVYAFSYVKLLLTVFKYVPQAVENHRRRSTAGWSIGQVLLDFAGGILSLAQLVIDCALQADWSGLVGNPAKLGLANVSLLFDVIFMVQHYVLYRGRTGEEDGNGLVEPGAGRETEDERRPLLRPSRDAA